MSVSPGHSTINYLVADARRRDHLTEARRDQLASLVMPDTSRRDSRPRLSGGGRMSSSISMVVRLFRQGAGSSRRRRGAVAMIVALVVAGASIVSSVDSTGATPAAVSCDPCPVAATSDLNLRSGPGTSYQILAVIPKGDELLAASGSTNGFAEVVWAGTSGWAHRDYLVAPDAVDDIVGIWRTTVDHNLRSGPGTGNQLLRVMPARSWVEVTSTVIDGFRFVFFDGLPGWSADQYLTAGPSDGGQQGSTGVVTVDLNLRAGPSTGDAILTVMQAGTTVRLGDEVSHGFRRVTYNGITGWAYASYLA